MTTFTVGEAVYVRGMHRNYKPVIVKLDTRTATVATPGIAGSERTFKVNELEKLSTTKRRAP